MRKEKTMVRFDRKKAREELSKRTTESYDRREGDISPKYFRTDKELPFWSPKKTKDEPHIIDIIPFSAGKNYPLVDKKSPTNEGDYTYLLEVYVHQNIGPGKEMLVCPARNYGKPCPICEEVDNRIKLGKEWDDYSDIALKRRCAYNIVCYDDPKEEAKGVQIWEVSHRYSEKPIQLAAKTPRGGGIIPFSDPDTGKSISFEVADDEYKTCQGHKLIDRDYSITDDVLALAHTLDELIIVLSYEEIAKIFDGGESAKKETVISDDKTSEEPTSYTRGSSMRNRQTVKDDKVCPAGANFGKDIDVYENCGDCKVYNECAKEADHLLEEEKKKSLEAKKTTTSTLRRRS